MTRFLALVKADMRFQFRYGFYALYALLSALYVAAVRVLPPSWRENARALIVFSDPAALGLMFMGAILLFEKGERVLSSLAVSPVGVGEYVASKCVSLSVISTVSGFAIARLSGGSPGYAFAAGVAGASVMFSLLGVAIGSRARSLNQFLVLTVPAELAIFGPAFLRWFGVGPAWLDAHPGSAALALMKAADSLACQGAGPRVGVGVAIATLVAWIVLFAAIALRGAKKMFRDEGKGDRP